MKPPDMELGFDSHAPPRRPAARPSAGPGSNYCCVGPALADALPPDYPLDLVPLTHSYLLSDAPSRSFLTTPPLPAQGTIQWSVAAQIAEERDGCGACVCAIGLPSPTFF